MADWMALDSLLTCPQAGRPVGLGAHGMVDHAALQARSCAWQAAFAARPGRDWALYVEDTLEFAAALYGAWHAGKRVVLCADNLPGTLQQVAAYVDGHAGDLPSGVSGLACGAVTTAAPQARDVLDERSCELVVFTSGSTGQPAAIVKRLDQLAREVEALQQAFAGLVEGAQVHGTVSHQHIYGLLFRVLWPLASGRPILPRRFFHEDLVAGLAQGPSILVATPAHLKRLPGQLSWQSVHGQVRAVFSSGGPLSAEAAALATRLLAVPPIEVFGSSETGGIAWRQSGDAQGAWRPLPGVQWRLDQDCLSVNSAHLAEPGWWATQDRARALADGGFQLLGRADRIVKIEERRVSLDALERGLCLAPGVAEARVLVLPGAREQLAAAVVPVDPTLLDAPAEQRRAFQQSLNTHLASHHDAVTRPRRWRLCAALPLNAQGKVTQAALQALFQPLLPEPQWLQRGPEQARLQLVLDPALKVFEGHFPQAAILPGVAQLDWAIHFARQCFALPAHFQRMETVKFQHVARPGDVLDLALELSVGPAHGVLTFRYTSAAGVHASGRVVFADAA